MFSSGKYFSLILEPDETGVTVASEPVIQVDANVDANLPPPTPPAPVSEGGLHVPDPVMKDKEDDEPLSEHLVQKRNQVSAEAGGSGVANAGE